MLIGPPMRLLSLVSSMGTGRALLGVLLPLVCAAAVPASPPAAVAVHDVTCSLLRNEGGWLELAVELEAGVPSRPREWVDHVTVTVWLAYEPPAASGAPPRRFHAAAECVTVPSGRSTVRFYLPPEVVVRDQVRTDRIDYVVELQVDGRKQEWTEAAVCRRLRSSAALAAFLAQSRAAEREADGVLRSQAESPFAWDPRRPTPAMRVRR